MRIIIAEGVIEVLLQMAVWILGKLLNKISMTLDTQLTVILVVHLLSVTKTIASQAPATQAQIFSSLVFTLVSQKQKSLVFSRNMAMSKVVRS